MRLSRAAGAIVILWTAVMAVVVLALRATPLYTVETDLLAEYAPAAREIRSGHLSAEHYSTKGFGYPLLVAAAGAATGGDDFLAARLINLAAAAAAAWAAYRLIEAAAGSQSAVLVLCGLLLTPAFVRATLEAGTDLPAFALAVASTHLLLGGRRARTWALAGLLAGYAVITRYNTAFLLAAAAALFVARPSLRRGWLPYAAGAALPLAAWGVANGLMTGSPWTNANHLNVAYSIFGTAIQRRPDVLAHFRSLGDVIGYDPGRVAAWLGSQIVDHLSRDLTQLVPPWLGIAAVLGVARWKDLRQARSLALHLGLSFLVLAWVFYDPRFSLYHAPFLLTGAALFVTRQPLPAALRPARAGREAAWRMAVMLALIAGSGFEAVRLAKFLIEREPREVREAAAILRDDGGTGQRLMARKPHVAYFAAMTQTALPLSGSLSDLVREAHRAGARYLYFSGIERQSRMDLGFLADSGVRAPGLEPLAFRSLDPLHYFALYRITGTAAADSAGAETLLEFFRRRATEHPDDPAALTDYAEELTTAGRIPEALSVLERARVLDPDDGRVAANQLVAYLRAGDLTRADEAGRRALKGGTSSWWVQYQLGRLYIAEGRYRDACRILAEAVNTNPSNPQVRVTLGLADLAAGLPDQAEAEFDRALVLSPGDVWMRLQIVRYLRHERRLERALAVVRGAPAEILSGSPELRAIADTLRAEIRVGR
jgi:tetratricopeptide (TPR) repeat protein